MSIICEVLQGVLRSTLFKININEPCQLSILYCETLSLVDDTALIVLGFDWSNAKSHVEQGIDMAMNWLNINLLTVNIDEIFPCWPNKFDGKHFHAKWIHRFRRHTFFQTAELCKWFFVEYIQILRTIFLISRDNSRSPAIIIVSGEQENHHHVSLLS